MVIGLPGQQPCPGLSRHQPLPQSGERILSKREPTSSRSRVSEIVPCGWRESTTGAQVVSLSLDSASSHSPLPHVHLPSERVQGTVSDVTGDVLEPVGLMVC